MAYESTGSILPIVYEIDSLSCQFILSPVCLKIPRDDGSQQRRQISPSNLMLFYTSNKTRKDKGALFMIFFVRLGCARCRSSSNSSELQWCSQLPVQVHSATSADDTQPRLKSLVGCWFPRWLTLGVAQSRELPLLLRNDDPHPSPVSMNVINHANNFTFA